MRVSQFMANEKENKLKKLFWGYSERHLLCGLINELLWAYYCEGVVGRSQVKIPNKIKTK